MRKIILACMMILLLGSGTAYGDLIGIETAYPDIFSNTAGTYTYDATNNLLTFAALPETILFGEGGPKVYFKRGENDFRLYTASFHVDESGNFVSGVDGNDLEIWGTLEDDSYTGLILAGEVTNFGWQYDAPYLQFDFTFDFVEGALEDYYAVYGGKGGDYGASEQNTFTNWTMSSYGTKTKHDTAPSIPEASTLMLFGSGLSGVLFYVRKKGLIKI